MALPSESAGVLLRLHSAPIYFHRKGRGRFRKAPPDILKAALAGLEKKRLQQEQIEHWSAELQAGRTPPEIAAYRAAGSAPNSPGWRGRG